MIDTAVSEIDGLVNAHRVIRLVTFDRYQQVLQDRGPENVKLLHSLLLITTKRATEGEDIYTASTTRITASKVDSQHANGSPRTTTTPA